MAGFIERLNNFLPMIKFTAECCKENRNFLDVNIRSVDSDPMTDLFIETTGTHQFLDPISSHPDHRKKEITYSKALRLNRICFGNGTFDKRSNDLERRLLETGYNKR